MLQSINPKIAMYKHVTKNQNFEKSLEHAWKYFELHANQRITIFNYFLIISGALSAGLATTLQGSQRFSSLGVVLGVLLVVVSFVFWKLDQRVSYLIKHAETVIGEIEHNFPDQISQVFILESVKAKDFLTKESWWSRHWTYGSAFRFVFGVMAVFGAAGSILSFLKFIGFVSW